MTAALPVAEKIRTRYRAERQRFSEAQYVLRPPERLLVQAEALGDYLNRGDSVLDVGCGTGYLSAHVQEMYRVRPCGVDVRDFHSAQILFRLFDGTSIPFPDKSFDHVALSEVRHHSHDPMALLMECCRVVRRSIILFEDMPDGRVGKVDPLPSRADPRAALRYSFKAASIRGYRSALRGCTTTRRVSHESRRNPNGFVYPRVLFVCDVTNAAW